VSDDPGRDPATGAAATGGPATTGAPATGPVTYAGAGVDIAGGDEAVRRIRAAAASTARPGVLEGIGGFAGRFALDTARYRHPVLVSSTDGVGTKLLVARATGRYDTVGVDLVAMCVDDLVCLGAEPLFLLDYVAMGHLDAGRLEAIVAGIAAGCRDAGCALLGGETAEHPDAMDAEDVDVAGFAVGVVESGAELGPGRVRPGDVLVGLLSPGLRSNGYSLARHVLLQRAARPLDAPAWEGAGHSLADELLRPSVVYAPAVLAAAAAGGLHACAHVTGGGIPGNLVRVLPPDLDARVRRDAWTPPRIFGEIARLGPVNDEEMLQVFNMGLGMVLVVAADAVDSVLGALAGGAPEVRTAVVGEVVAGSGRVRL
jgi:phosphoribosylformylglycinamidine cyclo-ligase